MPFAAAKVSIPGDLVNCRFLELCITEISQRLHVQIFDTTHKYTSIYWHSCMRHKGRTTRKGLKISKQHKPTKWRERSPSLNCSARNYLAAWLISVMFSAPCDVTVPGAVGCWVQSFASSALSGAVELFGACASSGSVTRVGRFAFTETPNRLTRQQIVSREIFIYLFIYLYKSTHKNTKKNIKKNKWTKNWTTTHTTIQ